MFQSETHEGTGTDGVGRGRAGSAVSSRDDGVGVQQGTTAVVGTADLNTDDVGELSGGCSRATNDLDGEVILGFRRGCSSRKCGERKEKVLELHDESLSGSSE